MVKAEEVSMALEVNEQPVPSCITLWPFTLTFTLTFATVIV